MNSRRDFLKMGAAAAIGFPTIVPASVFGQTAPSNRINRLYWDPVKEHFKNDDDANCMLSRPQRAPYMMDV
jgi:hypothetical protein